MTTAPKTPEPCHDLDAVVGAELRRQRIASGMTIGQVAKASGLSSAMISKLENGLRGFTLSTLAVLSLAVKINVVRLLGLALTAPTSEPAVPKAKDLPGLALGHRRSGRKRVDAVREQRGRDAECPLDIEFEEMMARLVPPS